MKKVNFVSIQSQFGFEMMAMNFAKVLGLETVIIPNKEDKKEFEEESQKILDNLSFFSPNIFTIRPKDKNFYGEMSRDVIAEHKADLISKSLWNSFAGSRLTPNADITKLPTFWEFLDQQKNLLLIPQKLISDESFGKTASQQSLMPSVFNFLKKFNGRLCLGQHFNKVTDVANVEALQKEFPTLWVPGQTSHPEVFGIRGVKHAMYYNMYRHLDGAVGIPGTHTWYLLVMFPEIPQVITYRKGIENWDVIAKAYQNNGYPIEAIGFDDTTDMTKFSVEVEAICRNLGVI